MKKSLLLGVFLMPLFFLTNYVIYSEEENNHITKIGFGSCAHQSSDLAIFDVIMKRNPQLFIFMGDNIYSDTKKDPSILKENYDRMAANAAFKRLKAKIPNLIATWDDHDYGQNDAGKEYSFKSESKELFLNFWGEPINSERRKHKGIYTSYLLDEEGKKVQIIVLDTRTFRDKLHKDKRLQQHSFYHKSYKPHSNPKYQILGNEQWRWLEAELAKTADVRILVSSIQFGIEPNGYECWANFPCEQEKLFNLIRAKKANGLFIISGDVHYAEISKIIPQGLYPIYDITSSGLSQSWKFATPNNNRIEGPIMEHNFGLITIDWSQKEPSVEIEIIDNSDNQRIELNIPLHELTHKF